MIEGSIQFVGVHLNTNSRVQVSLGVIGSMVSGGKREPFIWELQSIHPVYGAAFLNKPNNLERNLFCFFMIFKRKLSPFFLTDKKTIFGRDCNSSFTLAVTFYKWLCRPLLIKSEEGRIWSFKKSEIWKSDFKIPILWIYFPFTVPRLIRTNTFRD